MNSRRNFIAAMIAMPFVAREALRLRLSPLKRIGSVMTAADWGYSFKVTPWQVGAIWHRFREREWARYCEKEGLTLTDDLLFGADGLPVLSVVAEG
jgi:hypothetical protein